MAIALGTGTGSYVLLPASSAMLESVRAEALSYKKLGMHTPGTVDISNIEYRTRNFKVVVGAYCNTPLRANVKKAAEGLIYLVYAEATKIMKSVHKLMVLIGVIIVGLSLSSTADQLDTWRGMNPLPQGNNLDVLSPSNNTTPSVPQNPPLDKAEFAKKTGKLRIPFIENNGQVDEQVKFYAKTFGGTVFVTKDGEIVYALPKSDDTEGKETYRKDAKERIEQPVLHKDAKNTKVGIPGGMDCTDALPGRLYDCPSNKALEYGNDCLSSLVLANFDEFAALTPSYTSWNAPTGGENPPRIVNPDTTPKPALQNLKSKTTGIALREEFVGARISEVQGEEPSVTKVNYFKGNDPEKWKTDVSTYNYVNLGEVYKGIELKLKAYGDNVEKLFCVKPGADPEQIKIRLSGIHPELEKKLVTM